MGIKLSQVPAWTDAVPAGSYISTAIYQGLDPSGNPSFTLRSVAPSLIGAVGPAGTAGSVIYNGAGAPALATGVDGDYHFNLTNGDMYYKTSGVWNLVGSFAGPAGADGAAGAAGAVGPIGPAGVAGAAGADGADAVPGGAVTQVQYHDGGAPAVLGGDSKFVWDKTNDELHVDGNIRQGVLAESYAATVTLDFREESLRTLTVTGACTFAASNLAAGRAVTVVITDNGGAQTLAFNANWTFVGTKPTAMTASKVAVLSLTSLTGADTGVIAAFAEEQ